MSGEKSLFERSEFMIFQTKEVFLSKEKFESESFCKAFFKKREIKVVIYTKIQYNIYN